jgi:hypothetical protein
MTHRNYKSPRGDEIRGTVEKLEGYSEIDGIDPETGIPEFAGWTEIFYDLQVTDTRDGKLLFLCEKGDEWTFDRLIPCDDEHEPRRSVVAPRKDANRISEKLIQWLAAINPRHRREVVQGVLTELETWSKTAHGQGTLFRDLSA